MHFMDYAHYQYIAASRRGGILTLTLNRPEALNAINDALHEELGQIFIDVARDDAADVVILTGRRRPC